MKTEIHPSYEYVIFRDANTGTQFLSRSTVTTKAGAQAEFAEWEDGKTYPLVVVDVTSDSHPFWTGTQRLMDSEGRVEKFERRYGARTGTRATRRTGPTAGRG